MVIVVMILIHGNDVEIFKTYFLKNYGGKKFVGSHFRA